MKRWITKHPRPAQWIMCGLITLLFFVLQTIPGFFAFGQYKLSLLLPFAVSMAVFLDVYSSALFGAVLGVLWDISAGRLVGFGGLILLILCFFISLSFNLYFRATPKMCGLASMASMGVYLLIDYVFYYLTSSFIGGWRYLLLHVGPAIISAFAVGFLMFWLCRALSAIGDRDPEY